MTFKRLSIAILILGVAALLACGGSKKMMAGRLITLHDSIPVNKLTRLVIMESKDSRRMRPRLRVMPNQSVDLFARAADDSGNIYILPPKFKPSWSIVSYADLKQGVIEPMNETMYPTETIDAASSRPAKAHVVRFTVVDPGMSSPVGIEARIVFRDRSGGEKILTGGIQLEIIQSDVKARKSDQSTFF